MLACYLYNLDPFIFHITHTLGPRWCALLGTSNVAPLLVGGQINPALSQNHIQVIKETHGKTSQLSPADFDALVLYLKSLQ